MNKINSGTDMPRGNKIFRKDEYAIIKLHHHLKKEFYQMKIIKIIFFCLVFIFFQSVVFPNSYQPQNEYTQGNTYLFICAIIFMLGILAAIAIRYLEKKKFISEITKQKNEVDELNKNLSEANKKLYEIISTRDKFVSIIAHELKSPFNSIIGFSEIIAEETKELSDDEIIEYANSIRDSSKNTLLLLQNLLDWGRAQTGAMKIDKAPHSLLEIVLENIRLYKLAAERKKINFVNNVSKDVIVYADESMVSAIVRNLIGNAIKFTMSGTVTIDAVKSNGYAEVSVTDTGIGISEETIRKLLHVDSFYTTRGTENEKGTGLGLTLVKEFVSKNGGKLKVISEVGQGSKFSFTLPLYK